MEVQYSKEKHQVILTPVQRGETTLTIRDDAGDIREVYNLMVTAYNLPRLRDEFAELLHSIRGIKVKITGDLIVVDGEVDDLKELIRLDTALNTPPYSEITRNMVIMSDHALEGLARQITDEIKQPGIAVRVWNHSFVVEGEVEKKEDASRAIIITNQLVHTFKGIQPVPNVVPRLKLKGSDELLRN
jgi:hypothetical protein